MQLPSESLEGSVFVSWLDAPEQIGMPVCIWVLILRSPIRGGTEGTKDHEVCVIAEWPLSLHPARKVWETMEACPRVIPC